MYWLFNNTVFRLRGGEVIASWQQSRNFKGEIGDEVIFYVFENRRGRFTHLYKITQVSKLPENGSNGGLISVTLQLLRDFGEEKEMEDYIYSFPRIKYFSGRLYRHFNRKYYRITEQEFLAIVEDQIFLSRTILGVSLNSMHVDHRRAFSRQMIVRYPDVLQNIYRHSEILDLLREYFEYAIIKPARQLNEAFETMQQIVSNDIPLGEIGFYDNANSGNAVERNQVSVRNQVNVIREYLEQVNISISENGRTDLNEYRFESIFRNRPLPIDLND